MFRRAFAQLGIAAPIQVVRDGEQAMAYLKGTGRFSNRAEFPLPDIFLLDLKIPCANGFGVLEWLRAQARFSSIRVVVLTTSGDVDDINKAYDLGATSFLTKPGRLPRIPQCHPGHAQLLANRSARPEFARVQRNLAAPKWKNLIVDSARLPPSHPGSYHLARHAARRGGDCDCFR